MALFLFVPLVALGVGSVLHWHYTETLGRGDERLYALVQFFPMIALPILLLWFPAGTSRTRDLFLALGFYAVAKVFEQRCKLGCAEGGHRPRRLQKPRVAHPKDVADHGCDTRGRTCSTRWSRPAAPRCRRRRARSQVCRS